MRSVTIARPVTIALGAFAVADVAHLNISERGACFALRGLAVQRNRSGIASGRGYRGRLSS